MSSVTIVDYACGNAQAVRRSLFAAGVDALLTNDPAAIDAANAIVLPGVGHAGRAMKEIDSASLRGALDRAAFDRKVPILGICLGMHLMTDHLEEGNVAGLGWVTGRTAAIAVSDHKRFKIPHIGWTSVTGIRDLGALGPSGGPDDLFYFCHKYEVVDFDDDDRVANFHYERDRLAMFQRGNLTGVQFHPEKSREAGIRLLRDWLAPRTEQCFAPA